MTKDNLDVVFNHLSYPKYYPNWLVDNHDLIYEHLGEHIRMYSAINDNVGYDFDLRVLQFFTQGMCPNYYDPNTGKAIDGENIYKNKEYMGKYLHYVSFRRRARKTKMRPSFPSSFEVVKGDDKVPRKPGSKCITWTQKIPFQLCLTLLHRIIVYLLEV